MRKMDLKYIGLLIIFLFFCFLPVTSASSKIYVFIDSNGIKHYTNTPTSDDFRLYYKEDPKKAPNYYPGMYDHIIKEASEKHKISFYLIKALIKVESDFNHKAISRVGAKGLMQLMPQNIQTYKIKDPFNPKENIMAGSDFIKVLLVRFKGKLPLALAAYNAGPTAVEKYKNIPPYKETERFVMKVMSYYNLLLKER